MSKVLVTCSKKISSKCRGTYAIGRRAKAENLKRNKGCFRCLFCARAEKMGENNPNAQYEYDRNMFKSVDTEEKAYLLGWIASDGSISSGDITLAIHKNDRNTLEYLAAIVCSDFPIKEKANSDLVYFRISSKEIVNDICKLLSVSPGKKSDALGFPELASDSLQWAFIRGLFEGDGTVNKPTGSKRSPSCSIASNSAKLRQALSKFCNIPCYVGSRTVEWYGNNALDFLGNIYDTASYALPRKRDKFIDWSTYVPSLMCGSNIRGQFSEFRWAKLYKDAVAPAKKRVSDSGYDLTLIRKVKQIGNVCFYGTGIKVRPEYGWYFDLVGRSSIVKSGYLLANGFGVIDRTYVGEILVPLIKIDPAAPELKLPNRLVQIIPRLIVNIDFLEVDSLEDIWSTSRADGGFGSTGV